MAKKEKTKKLSKGERPNVSNEYLKLKNSDPRKIEDTLKSIKAKERIIEKPQTPKEKELKAKFLEDEKINNLYKALSKQFPNVSKAAIIQAIKTDKVAERSNIWSKKDV